MYCVSHFLRKYKVGRMLFQRVNQTSSETLDVLEIEVAFLCPNDPPDSDFARKNIFACSQIYSPTEKYTFYHW